MNFSQDQIDKLARERFVDRMTQMLFDAGSIDPSNDRKLVRSVVAAVIDEASSRGIRTERLLGMYVLLRVADRIDPFADERMAAVLNNAALAEDDKAHLLQMIRIGELDEPNGGR